MPNKVVGTLGQQPTIEIAGRTFVAPVLTDATPAIGDTVILYTGTIDGAGTAYDFGSLRRPGATTGFQVPSAMKLHLQAVRITNMSAVAAYIDIGYADNDPGAASLPYHNTAPTNDVYEAGGSAGPLPHIAVGSTVGATSEKLLDLEIAATKFLQIGRAGGTAGVIIEVIGILESP